MTVRAGIGYDVHALVPGRTLVLGGVVVPSEKGLDGHSDADVLCHAVMDALLGAMADGDIGTHFPNSDQRWKNADSVELLRMVARRLRDSGAEIVNVDATIIAEAPRLAPFMGRMAAAMAAAMGIPAGSVSVKATTNERMGFLGRGEGIAALAIASVQPGRA
jgi:2-C-methyl-D-erythritol 2,4-cyclodiphosphate synthase